MKILITSLAALTFAGAAPSIASAADLGYDYSSRGGYVEDRPPPPPRPRVERYYDEYEAPPPVVYYDRYPRPYPYFAADPYWGPRWHRWPRPYWRAHYWGPRGRW